MVITLRKLLSSIFLFLLFGAPSFPQELADYEEVMFYQELLKASGESLYMPTHEDMKILLVSLSEEIAQQKANLTNFYGILKKLGFINQEDVLEMELRNYKEHFFERKEMEIFEEFIKIEWQNGEPQRIIIRNKSTLTPKMNIRNTFFVLPIGEYPSTPNKDTIMDSRIEVLAKLSYQAGVGEEFYFVFPSFLEERDSVPRDFHPRIYRVYDYTLGRAVPKIISDPKLKILTMQYIVYRLRYLDVRFRYIIRNRLRKNTYEFYRSIPDTRY